MDIEFDRKLIIVRVAALVSLLAVVAYVSTVQPSGIDFWMQAKIGDIIFQNHKIPETLLFPFTEVADQKFNAHEWLVSIGFGLLVKSVGVQGLTYVLAGLGVMYFIAAAMMGYLRSNKNIVAALIAGLIAILTENYRHVLRPELISLFFMIFCWMLLERMKYSNGFLLLMGYCALVIVWANSHGSFILSFILPCIYAGGAYVEEIWQAKALCLPSRHTMCFALLSVLALISCLINPFGWDLVKFVFHFGADNRVGIHITEWIPTLDPRFLKLPTFWVFFIVWLFVLIVMVVGRGDIGVTEWFIFLFFTFLSIKAIRFPVYLGMMAAYIISPILGRRLDNLKRQFYGHVGLLLIGVCTFILVFEYKNLQGTTPVSLGSSKMSDQMVEALMDTRRRGNVLNSMELGAELTYWAYPRMRPASDCRVDSYGFDYLNFLSDVLFNDGLLTEFVARYDVRYILIDLNRFFAFVKLNAWKTHQWEVVLMDSRAVLLRRNDVEY